MMDNPGPLQLTFGGSAFSIVGPGTFVGDWIDGLAGMVAVTLQAAFLYGGGGASVTLYIQTSIDQGQTPIDIAAIAFTTANGTAVLNLSGLAAVVGPTAPTQQGLAPGTCLDGPLGDRLRAVVVVTGTYSASTLLNVTAVAR